MGTRKTSFENKEFYHIYNRGVEKRDIFSNYFDLCRFFQSMEEFNVIEPIGSVYENRFRKNKMKAKTNKNQLGSEASKLVNFIAFCLNPNHFHFILEQVSDKGIEKFMHRIGTGYTKYFNNKEKRTGVLFQGVFQSKHIDSNEYLLHLSAYVNLNNHPKLLGSEASKLSKSSWWEYLGKEDGNFCRKEVILDQFNSIEEYEKFAISSLDDIVCKKKEDFDSD